MKHKKNVIEFFRNPIQLLKLFFLAGLETHFSIICTHMLSKCVSKPAQKYSIFLAKASFKRALIALLVIFVGCTVGPDYHEPEVCVPCTWTNPYIDMQEPAVMWWTQLNDAVLNTLIEKTIACNWDLKKATSNILQARASAREVNSFFWPMIGVVGGATGLHLPKDNFFLTPERDFAFYNVGFDGFWELDLFGKIRRLSEAARANVRMKREEARGVMITLIAETVRDYIQLRGLQAQEEFLYQMLDVQQDSYALTKCLSDQGIIGLGKLSEMQGSILDIEAQIEAIKAAKQSLIMSLGILTSMWPVDISLMICECAPLPDIHESPQAGTPFSLLRRRPDIRAAEENLHIASAEIGAAIAAFYPSLDLWALIGQSAIHFSDLFKADNRNVLFGGIISVPIFHGNQLVAKLEFQKAKEQEAWSIYAKAVIKAVNEVDASVMTEQFQHNRYLQMQDTAATKRVLYKFAQQFFDEGITSALQLNSEKIAWLSAESHAIQAQVDWMQSWISSYKAFGGGWE